jgi:hypothetical protein
VVDPEERCVWVWRFAAGASEPERIVGRLEWRPADVSEPLVVDLEQVLKPI